MDTNERHPLQQVATDLWDPDPAIVGYLPRVWCKACRDARGKHCDQHQVIKCGKCRNNITVAHVDLDYVGHADVTRQLTMIDPAWNWEPCGLDESGQPIISMRGNKTLVLWGRLTLHGVARLCVGSCEVDKLDADKELVGDLIRNGAMRHNVFGGLWSKAEGATFENTTPEPQPSPTSNGHTAGTPSTVEDRRAIKALFMEELTEHGRLVTRSWAIDHGIQMSSNGQVPMDTTIEQLAMIRDYIIELDNEPAEGY